MRGPELELSTWSALLAALAYSALALRLLRFGSFDPQKGRAPLLFMAAIVASAAWGWAGVLGTYLNAGPSLATGLLDLLRYACWFAFLLSVLAPAISQRRRRGIAPLVPVALILVTTGVVLLAFAAQPAPAQRGGNRFALFESLSLAVFGLILAEQLFRNVADESRWNAKPLCLGLSVIFVFDLYVYSQAILFGEFDVNAFDIRAGIHALAVPLLFLSSRRRSEGSGWCR